MGWCEFAWWIGVMGRQQHPPGTDDPGSWAGSDHDPGWQDLRARHARALRGETAGR